MRFRIDFLGLFDTLLRKLFWYSSEGVMTPKDRPERIVDRYGNVLYKLNGELHREDGPAVEWVDGSKSWYLKGELHREDGPAVKWAKGSKAWYLNGKRHREDGPAVEYASGRKEWYLNGRRVSEEDVMG